MARTWNVSILLLKPNMTGPEVVFGDHLEDLETFEVGAGSTTGVLYVATTPASPPDWTRLFAGSTDRDLALERPNFGAVFLLQASQRWFAVTFGTGRFFVSPDCFERRFGLKAALNLVDPAALRSAQSRTFDDTALHVHRQASRLSDIAGLDLNTDRDLLVNLSGATADGEIGKRISGSDAARLTDEFVLGELKQRCSALLKAYRRTDYKKHFPWVDTVQPLEDIDEVKRLDEKASDQIHTLNFAGVDVYPPELIDETIAAFRLGSSTIMEPDALWLDSVVRRLSAPDSTELRKQLGRMTLKAVDDDGTSLKSWPLWDCLHLETTIGRHTYVLDRGDWFRIDRSFAKAVNDFVGGLKPSGLAFPKALHNEVEGDYNERVAGLVPDFLLADRDLVRPVPGESRIEVCDLFDQNTGHMIHVKRRKGGSSPLSHLFGQALVSGLLFAREPQYVAEIRKMLSQQGYTLAADASPQDHPIVLALMVHRRNSSGPNLPFFSKVNLREHARQLQTARFQVFLDEIEAPISTTTGHAAKLPNRRPARRSPA